jgi:hypothetical protein
MKSETGKRGHREGYALKPSVLSAALEAAALSIDTHLVRGSGDIFLDAHFWPSRPGIPYERLYVRAGTVPVERVTGARVYVESEAIPQLVAWIAAIVASDSKSPVRHEEQYIHFNLPQGFV